MYRISLLILFFATLFLGCEQEKQAGETAFVPNRFEDTGLQTIHDHQDHRYLDSLSQYFHHSNPAYRLEAALACASLKQGPAVPFLTELLSDEDPAVATAAAYALGQTGDSSSAAALRLAIALPDSAWNKDGGKFYSEALQALGKIGNELDLQYVVFQHGELTASQEVLPVIRSIYQFGLRGVKNASSYETATDAILDGQDLPGAQLAANFFARQRDMDEKILLEGVLEDFEHLKDPVIRMNIARAMRNLEPENGAPRLLKIASDSKEDYRTRVSALDAYKPLKDSSAFKDVASLMDDANVHVAHAAAVAIRKHPLEGESADYLAKAEEVSHPGIRGELFRAAVKAEAQSGAAPNSSQAVKEALAVAMGKEGKSINYEIGLYLVALAEAPENIEYLFDQVLSLKDPVQKGYAMIGITIAFLNPGAPPAAERLEMLREALKTQDAAVRSLVAYELRRTEDGYKSDDLDVGFIEEALAQIKLPEGIEAYRDLQTTLYYLTDEERPILKRTDYNHPIDWDLVSRISSDASATVHTNKGQIKFDLFVDETPATVANFVELAQAHFFEGKFFHRVVPNFVIQTGCPRGDGWGSLDHSIRSEFPNLHYGEGAVGMASAGKDTESSQFFITHSPTPHLDGRYTVFGKVTSGMDVVHLIEVGDYIEKIELEGVKSNPRH